MQENERLDHDMHGWKRSNPSKGALNVNPAYILYLKPRPKSSFRQVKNTTIVEAKRIAGMIKYGWRMNSL